MSTPSAPAEPPRLALPRLNEPAPQFSAPSTHGEIKLADFKGRWVVLFSHPGDFTPVCSTEFVAFAKAADDFARIDTQLVGLAIDSVYSHIAWVRSLEALFKVRIGFPVIADLDMHVSQLYGMIHAGASATATVRALFVIDPQQQIRAMTYYPMTVGRSVQEIRRLVQALQLHADKGLATPEGWQPGDPCIVPPPSTQADAEKRIAGSEHEVADWYFATTRR